MSIQVTIRQVYGRDTVYPVCERAQAFAELAGQKTLTAREIALIKSLGFTITVVSQQVTL